MLFAIFRKISLAYQVLGDGVVRSPEKYMKQWLHPVVFGAWTFVLFYLLLTRHYTSFLRPDFGLLLALALIIAVGFMFASMNRKAETDFSDVLRSLVLLIPILFLLIMPPDAMLGSNALKERFFGQTDISSDHQGISLTSHKLEKAPPELLLPAGSDDTTTQDSPYDRSILELFRDPTQYQNRRVIFTGMILRDKELKQYFENRDTAVYRFMINCCAADALPLAIAVDSDQVKDFANDQWVQVDGIFDLGKNSADKPIPFVKKAIVMPIAAPDNPYLFNLPAKTVQSTPHP